MGAGSMCVCGAVGYGRRINEGKSVQVGEKGEEGGEVRNVRERVRKGGVWG